MSPPCHWRRPVLKFGTSTLTAGAEGLSLARLADLVEQVAALRAAGVQPIIVSSGAVAAGRQRLGGAHALPRGRKDLPFKQVMAAIGQSRLMHLYDQIFEFHGITSAQVLLTRSDIDERQRYLNARDTLLELCERGVVPIVNENDAVSSDELKVGDNDTLSALVAGLVDADLLVLVSDIPGLYTADPAVDAGARLLPEVEAITSQVEAYAGGSRSGLGIGGMWTKLAAARLATAGGTEVRIVDGGEPNVVRRVLAGEQLGTRFLARTDPVEARKRWILSGLGGAGRLTVDEGARRALLERGASLLPAGILDVAGDFERGDPVEITGHDGSRVGRGIANYHSRDVRTIAGKHSSEIEPALGFSYGDYVIHRNNLICHAAEAGARHA
ncbi:MAG TPA: glutamate 5-kinase [Chloroflexota bacterium]|nr:glutamate 5-kinase [Chloroflexota bacterium]